MSAAGTGPATRPARLLAIVAGFALWHVVLIGLYALLSIGCELGWRGDGAGFLSPQRAGLSALWAALLGAFGLLLQRVGRMRRAVEPADETGRFVGFLAFGATLWALLAAVGLGLPLFGASACL